jgi:hypothetical protein
MWMTVDNLVTIHNLEQLCENKCNWEHNITPAMQMAARDGLGGCVHGHHTLSLFVLPC